MHENHPGHEQTNCSLRHTVTGRGSYGQITHAGYACLATGGHCLPCSYCDQRREEDKKHQHIFALLQETAEREKIDEPDHW